MDFVQKQELFQTVIDKAWDDPVFKQELIDRPQESIESLAKVKLTLPEGTRIVVCDQSDEAYSYINIPRKFDVDELELTDEELEMVAGGIAFVVTYIIATIGIGISAYASGQADRQ